ncbi:hypothetical protein RF11_02702 [Thelohanellus kitauei]|uniref:Uncharacterized protein n=1 Tax=Thelohanellus kitauei TaxID=669202 RepID=A0A0C2MUC2_THEKT|nr:hypothetical protein RF11_02702 [Thelohanellus kitauei]
MDIHTHTCEDPSAYVMTNIKRKKFKDNICVGDSKTEEMEICRFHQYKITTTLLIKNKLMFVDLEQIEMAPTMFSSDLQLNEPILNFKFDKFNKCVYYHVKNGIIRKCYGNKRELSKPPFLIIKDITIMGMDLDPLNHYLFYFNKHGIIVVNLGSLIRTTIYQTYNFMRYLKLDILDQKIIISYLDKHTKRSKIRIFSYSTTARVVTFDFDKEFHDISFYVSVAEIFTSDGIYKYQMEHKGQNKMGFNLEYSQGNTIPGVKYLSVHYTHEYVTDHGYCFWSYFVLMKNIRKANMELYLDPCKYIDLLTLFNIILMLNQIKNRPADSHIANISAYPLQLMISYVDVQMGWY